MEPFEQRLVREVRILAACEKKKYKTQQFIPDGVSIKFTTPLTFT